MSKFSWIIIVIVVVLAAGYFLFTSGRESTPAINQPTEAPQVTQGPTAQPTNARENQSVMMQNFAYNPATLSVKKGTTVTWTNQDSVDHDVVSEPNGDMFKSELFSEGESYSFTFNSVGTYNYYCSVHPRMKGSITVTE